MRLSSIRARMTTAFAVSNAVIMLVACGGLIWYSRSSAEHRAQVRLKGAAGKAELEIGDVKVRSELLPAIREESDELEARGMVLLVVDKNGRALWRSQKTVPPWPPVAANNWRTTTFHIGQYVYVVGLPWDRTEDSLNHNAVVLVLLSLFVVIVASGGAWALVGRTLSPIASLAREANMATADSLHVRLSESSRDAEIVELVAMLNGLLTRLSQTAAAKGRFYSSASHELRTPLQALTGHLELALSKPRTVEDYRSVIEEAYKQTRRLISLVQDLLLLNQLDSAPLQASKETADLGEICTRALSQLSPVIAERGLRVEKKLPDVMEIPGLPTHADMLIRNLVENAVKYASEGGRVSVELIQLPDGARFEVFNECAPLAVQDVNQLFEPFFRPDPSRQSGTGGNGLGLAICKALALANGWEVTLRQEESGVRAIVVFGSSGQAGGDAYSTE